MLWLGTDTQHSLSTCTRTETRRRCHLFHGRSQLSSGDLDSRPPPPHPRLLAESARGRTPAAIVEHHEEINSKIIRQPFESSQ